MEEKEQNTRFNPSHKNSEINSLDILIEQGIDSHGSIRTGQSDPREQS